MEGFLKSREQEPQEKASWRPTVEAVRAGFASLIGATPAEIALVKNTSEALNAVAHSIPWRPGDNVVLSATEHPNNLYPWLHIGHRYGVDVRLAACASGTLDVDQVSRLLDARTRAVTVSLVSFMPGTKADVEEIARLCRAQGSALVVDAIQAAGILPIDVGRMGIDALAAGGHKGLLGPYGIGFLYCRGDFLAEWEPAYTAGASIDPTDHHCGFVEDLNYRLLPTAARYEVGNYNYEGLHGQEVALRFLLSFDAAAVGEHVLRLSARLDQGLRDIGLPPLNPEGDGGRSGIVCFRARNPVFIREQLARRGTAVAVKGDALRVSFHVFNNSDDVDALLSDLNDIAGAQPSSRAGQGGP